jgi:ariadne-1
MDHMSDDEEYHYDSEDGSDYIHDDDDDEHSGCDTKQALRQSGRGPQILLPDKVPDGQVVITEYHEIIPMMDNVMKEVTTLLEIDNDSAQLLLQVFRWDKERLIDAFFSDPEKALREAGLDQYSSIDFSALSADRNASKIVSSSLASSNNTSVGTFPCRICCDECPVDTALSLGCKHPFCRNCYADYLRSQVTEGPACIRTHCPEHKCKQSVPKSFFVSLVDNATAERYKMFVTRNFIETSKTMRYCPAAGCDKVAIGSGVTTVRCSCNNPFCFRFGEEAHDPCSSSQLSEWAGKCMNESGQLDSRQHEEVPQMQHENREESKMQPHELQAL